MTRKKKLMLNSASSLIYQVATLICGFILPKFFLTSYGSAVNGLVSSITQFLGFISLAECGVGAVVQSALYKPLAQKDMNAVSKIVVSSERFFRKIAYLLVAYTAILMIAYPFVTIESFDYLYTLVLIFVMAISTFAQYYLGMTYKILLTADQLGFIQYTIHTVSLIINTLACIVLMNLGASIQLVKLVTSLIFVCQPVLLSVIAKHKYDIDHHITYKEEPVKQKWNGLAHHIAAVVFGNTDTVVLTLLSSLETVSIYAVYHLVVNGVRQLILSLTNGMQAMFGNMLAKGETEELNRSFENTEWLFHTLVTFVFTSTAILIVPFVRVYTANITDVDYIVPTFAYLITLAQAIYCIRLPYNIMLLAAGHYKQTQGSAIMEALINVFLSVILVFKFGLIGVAIGTFAAMAYRTVYLALYLSKDILYRNIVHFVKHILVDSACVVLIFAVVSLAPEFYIMGNVSYLAWIILAVKVGMTAVICCVIVNAVGYPKMLCGIAKKILEKVCRKDMFEKQSNQN